MRKFVKFFVPLVLIFQGSGAQSKGENSLINITEPSLLDTTQDLPLWFINSTNYTWSGCDKNESIAFCNETVKKNQTDSIDSCFKNKGCCEGNSITKYVPCPTADNKINNQLYSTVEALGTFITIFACCGNNKLLSRSLGVGAFLSFLSTLTFDLTRVEDESIKETVYKLLISTGLGTLTASSSYVYYTIWRPRGDELTQSLVQDNRQDPALN